MFSTPILLLDVAVVVEFLELLDGLAHDGFHRLSAQTVLDLLDALGQISPVDEYSQALAAFFNITPPVPDAVPMTQQEVEDDLDELWNLIITQ